MGSEPISPGRGLGLYLKDRTLADRGLAAISPLPAYHFTRWCGEQDIEFNYSLPGLTRCRYRQQNSGGTKRKPTQQKVSLVFGSVNTPFRPTMMLEPVHHHLTVFARWRPTGSTIETVFCQRSELVIYRSLTTESCCRTKGNWHGR